jgi:hypothetical protein
MGLDILGEAVGKQSNQPRVLAKVSFDQVDVLVKGTCTASECE